MLRQTLTIFSLVGLVLSVALWGVSYLNIGYRGIWHSIWIDNGAVQYWYAYPPKPSEQRSTVEELEVFNSVEGWHSFRFRRNYRTNWSPKLVSLSTLWFTQVPLWIPTLAFAVFPTIALVSAVARRRRLPPNHCKDCGYDLTGNVSGVCSECGEAT